MRTESIALANLFVACVNVYAWTHSINAAVAALCGGVAVILACSGKHGTGGE